MEVSVLEADSRAGGKIGSERIGGFLCEKGPGGFLDNKPTTLQLCDTLGLKPLRSNDNARKRFLFTKGKLNVLPDSPPAFLKSNILSWRGKIRMALDVIAPKGPADETVAEFVSRRLGSEALEQLIDPMVSGVYAGDPRQMSITSAFPRIKELEQQYGSLIRALVKIRKQRKKQPDSQSNSKVSTSPGGNLTSFDDGVQTLTDSLALHLGDRLRTGVFVHGLEKTPGGYRLHTSTGDLDSDMVVLATPAFVSADILHDLDQSVAQILATIAYPHVSVVCLGYEKEKVSHKLDGFGFLVPHKEHRKILGTLWDTSIFDNRAAPGRVLLRTMVGGAQYPEVADLDDRQLLDTVVGELQQILGADTDPDMVQIYRWQKAIPQYVLGHGNKLEMIDSRMRAYEGLYLTGNAYRGIGMNDCIANAYSLARDIATKLT